MSIPKPQLKLWQIINTHVGVFGIQYSFGLQQTAINQLYTFPHAKPKKLPLSNLAGPLTALPIDPTRTITSAGVLLPAAAILTTLIKRDKPTAGEVSMPAGGY